MQDRNSPSVKAHERTACGIEILNAYVLCLKNIGEYAPPTFWRGVLSLAFRRQVDVHRRLYDEKDTHWKMQTSREGAENSAPLTGHTPNRQSPDTLLSDVLNILDDAKAEAVATIGLEGKSSIADHMIVASGRSQRHVGAIADQVSRKLREIGYGRVRVEGMPHCDWVLIDAGNVIIHIFRPEVREFYNLEKMWSAPPPEEQRAV